MWRNRIKTANKMKKLLSIIGGIALLAIFAIGFIWVVSIIQVPKLNSSSKAYVENEMPLILSGWSADEIKRQSSPQLLEVINESQDNFEKTIKWLSKIGRLKSIGDIRGNAEIFYGIRYGEVQVADYDIGAKFEGGDAHIEVRLIKNSGKWKITYFHVNSPFYAR